MRGLAVVKGEEDVRRGSLYERAQGWVTARLCSCMMTLWRNVLTTASWSVRADSRVVKVPTRCFKS